MKFTLPRKSLLRALSLATPIADGRDENKAYGHVHLGAATLGDLIITAANRFERIQVTLSDAKISDYGAVTVDAKRLSEIARVLPASSDEVEFELPPGSAQASIRCGKSRHKIGTSDARMYPSTVEPNPTSAGSSIPIASLLTVLGAVEHAACTEETRPHLFGVHLRTEGKRLVAEATDGHRAAQTSIACELEPIKSLLLPTRSVTHLKRILAGASGDVVIGTRDSKISIRIGDVELATALGAQGQFPPLEKVIPQRSRHRAVVRRDALIAVLGAVSVAATAHDPTSKDPRIVLVTMTLSSGSLEIRARGTDIESTDAVDIDFAGEELTISCHPTYLLQALKALASDEVALHLTGALDPILVTSAESKDSRFVVMPMRA